MTVHARREALRERLDAAMERAVEHVRTARLITEESRRVRGESGRLRRRPARAVEDRRGPG